MKNLKNTIGESGDKVKLIEREKHVIIKRRLKGENGTYDRNGGFVPNVSHIELRVDVSEKTPVLVRSDERINFVDLLLAEKNEFSSLHGIAFQCKGYLKMSSQDILTFVEERQR